MRSTTCCASFCRTPLELSVDEVLRSLCFDVLVCTTRELTNPNHYKNGEERERKGKRERVREGKREERREEKRQEAWRKDERKELVRARGQKQTHGGSGERGWEEQEKRTVEQWASEQRVYDMSVAFRMRGTRCGLTCEEYGTAVAV